MNKKVLDHAIHEHNSGLGYIANASYIISEIMKTKSIGEDNNEIIKQSDLIIRGKKKCQEAIDYLYTNIKKDV